MAQSPVLGQMLRVASWKKTPPRVGERSTEIAFGLV